MASIFKSLMPYGISSGRYHFNIKKCIKNLLPAIIVEKIIKKNKAKIYTSEYLKNNYVSDLTESEKWALLAFLLMLERARQEVYYLEVGVYAGGTLKFLLANTTKTHFMGIDLFEDFRPSDDNTHIWKNYSRDQVWDSLGKNRVTLEKGDSDSVLKKIQKSSKKFDFIFIDGNHTYQATKDDFEQALPLLKENGYIAFHNCSPGLTQEDKYYLKLDGGPWMLTHELLISGDFQLVLSIDRIRIFKKK